MKHYLLTWYGITDLRAALQLEATDGPILSALKTGNYTDVVIVAYTNPSKVQDGLNEELRSAWEGLKGQDMETRLSYPRDKAQQLVDSLSNTNAGHTLFTNWLQEQLAAGGITCNIQLIPKELSHLNDGHGIHQAAAFALQQVLSDVSEKTITCFISPGTPVMAYTWALIASSHPQYNIGVIASSDPRRPPETIRLPKNLLKPVVAAAQTVKPSEYDVMIHLLGRERIPVYFGMLQFQAKHHVFITTDEFTEAAKVLGRLLPKGCTKQTICISSPFIPAVTREAIEKVVKQLPLETRISANLTGGTKLMFAGALSACWEQRIEPFYFEINHHNIIFIRDGSTVPFVGAKSVNDFLAVNGFKVIKQSRWDDEPCRQARLAISQELWNSRRKLGSLYQTSSFRSYDASRGVNRNPPFNWNWGNSHASFDASGNATLNLEGRKISVPCCDDYGQYLGGGWLEEYVTKLLRTLEQKGLIFDLRIGLEVHYADNTHGTKELPVGEFDCAFTDGKRLWIVECKAGGVKQEHIQKLENNLKTYGGIAAKGLLVTSFPIPQNHVRRATSSTSIHPVHPNDLSAGYLQRIVAS